LDDVQHCGNYVGGGEGETSSVFLTRCGGKGGGAQGVVRENAGLKKAKGGGYGGTPCEGGGSACSAVGRGIVEFKKLSLN